MITAPVPVLVEMVAPASMLVSNLVLFSVTIAAAAALSKSACCLTIAGVARSDYVHLSPFVVGAFLEAVMRPDYDGKPFGHS